MGTQKDDDDDARYRNRFKDGGNDAPMKRQTKRVYNKATGKFQDAAPARARRKTPEPGSGALAKRRKNVIDSNVKKATQ